MDDGIIFDIQRFSIHDGPGIRTIVFLKGCPLRCVWCANPESQNLAPDIFFMPNRCIRCGECFRVCRYSAIAKDVFTHSRIDRAVCVYCGACAEICPTGALVLKGKRMSVEEIFAEVTKDRRFFSSSGGGVTFSGGEPFSQPDFISALLERMRIGGVDTAVETAGDVPWRSIERCLSYIDHVLFDVKAFDAATHRRITGHDNALILENLERLSVSKVDLTVRMPIVPGVNDDEGQLSALANRLISLGIRNIELLAYHELGVSKYEYLDINYELPECSFKNVELAVQNALTMFSDFGVQAVYSKT